MRYEQRQSTSTGQGSRDPPDGNNRLIVVLIVLLILSLCCCLCLCAAAAFYLIYFREEPGIRRQVTDSPLKGAKRERDAYDA